MKELRRLRNRAGGLVALTALGVASIAVVLPSANAATPKCFGRRATIVGTRGPDQLDGTSGRDVIVAKRGNDTIDAGGGRDLICSGRGGRDIVFAGNGNDRIDAQRGFDFIFPGLGDDFADGGADFGSFVTYEGSSTPINADLRSRLVTGQGRDRLRNIFGVGGSESDDVLVGTNDFDDLEGYGGNDMITARGGEFDFINSGAGNDTVSGGGGRDLLDMVIAHAGPRIDDDVFATSGVVVNMPMGTAIGGADVGTDTFSGIEEVGTTFGDDTVIGTDADNFIVTWDGTDDLQGGSGDDILVPGLGNDTANGGDGDDGVDFFLTHPFEAGMDGPINADLGAGTATGQGTDELISIEGAAGTLLDDTLVGSNGDNSLLLGEEGSDTISGEAGDDLLDGDAFFFGVPEDLPGTDSLDGGGGQDICLGGETTAQCESFEAPAPQSSRAQRAAAVDRLALGRMLLHHYRPMRSMR